MISKSQVELDVHLIIDGQSVKAADESRVFETASGHRCQGADEQTCRAAVESCDAAFQLWSQTTVFE